MAACGGPLAQRARPPKQLKSRFVTVTVVPEPATLTQLAIGIGLLGVAARRPTSA